MRPRRTAVEDRRGTPTCARSAQRVATWPVSLVTPLSHSRGWQHTGPCSSPVFAVSAAPAMRTKPWRSPSVGARPWRWLASEQSLVREAKEGGRAIAQDDMIDEGHAQQLPRVHEPLHEGPPRWCPALDVAVKGRPS